jgi:hypothetical protein
MYQKPIPYLVLQIGVGSSRAIQEDRLKLQKELRQARQKLVQAQNSLKEAEFFTRQKVVMGQNLLLEAQQVGLIDSVLHYLLC